MCYYVFRYMLVCLLLVCLLQAQEFSTQSNYTATVSEYLFGKRLMEMSSLVRMLLHLICLFLRHSVTFTLLSQGPSQWDGSPAGVIRLALSGMLFCSLRTCSRSKLASALPLPCSSLLPFAPLLPQVLLALPLLFVFLHHCVLWPLSASYRKLELPQRLVTCQHAVYTLVFGASIVPQTVLAVRFLFGAWTGDILVARLWTTLVVFIMSRIAL